MEDGVRNLLVGIGQPAFAYRNFNHADHSALLEKWPLMALIAALPEMRGARPVPHIRSLQPDSAARSGLLSNYGAAAAARLIAPAKPAVDPARDLRSLLSGLSKDLK